MLIREQANIVKGTLLILVETEMQRNETLLQLSQKICFCRRRSPLRKKYWL